MTLRALLESLLFTPKGPVVSVEQARIAKLEQDLAAAVVALNSTTMACSDLWVRLAEYEANVPSLARVKRMRDGRKARAGSPSVAQVVS